MKAINYIKKILVGILGFIFFVFAIAMTVLLLNRNDFGVTQFGETSLIIINNQIAFENYKRGDLVLVEARKIDKIKEGDEIFVYRVEPNSMVSVDVGIVGKIHTDDNAISFENGAAYAMKYVIGSATKTYSDLGTLLSIVLNKWGFLFIILVPSFLVFIYELYALIVEIKYGKEELSGA